MKVIGIDIQNKRVVCFAMEKERESYSNQNNGFKYIELKDDRDNNELRDFPNSLFTFFNEVKPDKIAIIARQTKGKFAASSVSFKLEGLIQCYKEVNVEFVTKQALAAYYKKNELAITFDNAYQENAAKLAFLLLNK